MRAATVPVVVREMRIEDLAAVQEIDRVSFPIPWPERSYRFELGENPAAHLLVAEMDGPARPQVIAYAGYWLIVDEAHISTLAVHPGQRALGVGGRLLAATLEHAAQLGADLATLEVRVSNGVAVSLYRKHGFSVVGRRPRYYRDNDEDALLMTLTGLRQSRSSRRGGGG